MQNYVLVLDTNRQPLEPCYPARARQLLHAGKAAVLHHTPFTIILQYAITKPVTQESEVKIDPGAKTSGIVLVRHGQNGARAIWAAEIEHRGTQVKEKLAARRVQRQARRSRKTRHRKARFSNRTRPAGWLPPSLLSRVQNVVTWTARLYRWTPCTHIAVEHVKFDTQLMENPAIQGIEYQQGTLFEAELWEYVLERDGHKCAYCGATGVPLEKEHIIPVSHGGHNRVTNITPSCHPCNQEKGNQTAAEFGYPHVQAQVTQRSLRDVAAVNATRNRLVRELEQFGLPVMLGIGAQTKFNRKQQGYPKSHWIDAAWVGATGTAVYLDPMRQVLSITAMGRQRRQMQLPDRYGFPRTKPKQHSRIHGFRTGDLVKAIVPAGKKTSGTHVGRVAVRGKGSFRIGQVDGINWQYCFIRHWADGYSYERSCAVSSQA